MLFAPLGIFIGLSITGYGILGDRESSHKGLLRFYLVTTLLLGLVHVSSWWFLVYREEIGQETLEFLPLVLLLQPEGLLLPEHFAWTTRGTVLFTVALAAGNFLWAAMWMTVKGGFYGCRRKQASRSEGECLLVCESEAHEISRNEIEIS